MIYTVRVESGLLLNEYLDTDNTDKKIGSQKKNLFSKKEKIDSDSISLRSFERIPLIEMRNVYDLLESFYDANCEVIKQKRNGSKIFIEFTEVTGQILEMFEKITIDIDDIKRVTLISIPELVPYDLTLEPLSLGTFFKL